MLEKIELNIRTKCRKVSKSRPQYIQTAVPKQIKEYLGLKDGDLLEWSIYKDENGDFIRLDILKNKE